MFFEAVGQSSFQLVEMMTEQHLLSTSNQFVGLFFK